MTKSTKEEPFQVSHTKAWNALSPLLPSRNPDCDYWWSLTGVHLAYMVEAADYSLAKQYEALLFHYHWITPYMGPAPSPELTFRWPCVLTLEGLPIEYSWKWNTPTKRPEIRYTIEAKSMFSGTSMDPLNQDPAREMLYRLQCSFPGIDLTWTNHFLAALFDHDRSSYVAESEIGASYTTSVMIAAELKAAALTLKTYFIPQRLGYQQLPLPLWQEAITKLCSNCPAGVALYNFLNTPKGNLLSPTMLAVDNVIPARSRLKFYFQSPRTSFASTRAIMTLGGAISIPEERMQDLRNLIIAIVGLQPDFPEDAELPIANQFAPPVHGANNNKTLVLPGYGYYFDIAPGQDLPEIKLFVRLCVNGPDDNTLGRGLAAWMDARGRGQHCQQYLSMLESLATHRLLDRGKGVHTHVSCLIKKDGELDITSYLAPEVSPQPPMARRESQNGHLVTNGMFTFLYPHKS